MTVKPPHDFHDEQAKLELLLYVRLWEALHGTRVTILDDLRRDRWLG